MVVGEREIIRQLRVAYEESNEMHLTGDDIRLAMKMLIPAAKKYIRKQKLLKSRFPLFLLPLYN